MADKEQMKMAGKPCEGLFMTDPVEAYRHIRYTVIRNYLCMLNGIEYVKQEESYTSQASFWDRDDIPVYRGGDEEEYRFSGRRIKRGSYRSRKGKVLNADINGALNILRKSKVVGLETLYNRGEVDTPVRIRVA